ncbi:helix-turn-helix domain-containing protein [Neobacillus drentensis]|uniref:helix-turn-helix domain-containing protein n=1 Tax=Neobacillus drentensis TaxID=220684 RepID=UPI002FFE4352
MLTIRDISIRLGVNEETVRRWIRNGHLEAEQSGRTYYVREEIFERFMQERDNLISRTGPSISTGFDLTTIGAVTGGVVGGPIGNTIGSANTLSMLASKRKLWDDFSINEKLEVLEKAKEKLELESQKIQLEYKIAKMDLEEEIRNLKEAVR